MIKEKNKIIVISGPTASGKTSYSIKLAKENNGIIINADSMQVYKGLPILSSQPTIEERENIEHLLFSVLEPYDNCNVGKWLKMCQEKIEYCFNKGKIPIVVGGTGMYISKLINGLSQIPEIPSDIRQDVLELYQNIGYDEFYKIVLDIDKDYVAKININDKQRLMRVLEVYKITGKSIQYFINQGNIKLYPDDMFFHININPDRQKLYEKCELRFNKFIDEYNALEEISNFKANNQEIINNPQNYSIFSTIGLKEGIKFLNREITKEQFIEKSIKSTKNYAKRQYTWFNNQFKHFDLRITKI